MVSHMDLTYGVPYCWSELLLVLGASGHLDVYSELLKEAVVEEVLFTGGWGSLAHVLNHERCSILLNTLYECGNDRMRFHIIESNSSKREMTSPKGAVLYFQIPKVVQYERGQYQVASWIKRDVFSTTCIWCIWPLESTNYPLVF